MKNKKFFSLENQKEFIDKICKKHIEFQTKLGNHIKINAIKGKDFYKNKKFITKKSNVKKFINFIKCVSVCSIIFVSVGIPCTFDYAKSIIYKNSLETYSDLLETYNKELYNYVDKINNLNLSSDLEIVTKLIYDTRVNNYKFGEADNYGFLLRLAFADDEKVGKCRHLADDLAAKLNAINPKYNARVLTVYMDDGKYTWESFSNIGIIEEANKENNQKTTTANVENNNEQNKKLMPDVNHMVTIFTPVDKDYILVVDPTNPSIGIIANGKIYMFSTEDGTGLTFTPYAQALCVQNTSYSKIFSEFICSSFNYMSPKELNELKQEWGLEAQNEALEKIKNIDASKKVLRH